MPNITRQIPLGQCLIETLTADLAMLSSTEIRQTVVLLPTRRLQLHLASSLCRIHRGASWLPRLLTWDQFLAELVNSSDEINHDLTMVNSEAELILREMLSSSPHSIPNPKQAHELLHLLRELWRHGVRDTARDSMKSWLERQWHLSSEGMLQIMQRIDRVFEVLTEFEATLERNGYGIEEAILASVLRMTTANLRQKTWQPDTRRMIIAGLTSLPLVQARFLQELLRAELQDCQIELWLDQTWQELDQEAPLRRLYSAAAEKPTDREKPRLNVKALHSCLNPTQEVLIALERAMALRSAGTAWQRIIIAVPDEKIYASAFAIHSKRLGIPHNIPLARPWAATSIGQWMKAYQLLLNERTSEAWMHLLCHPLTRSVVTPVLHHPDDFFASQELWLEALTRSPYELPREANFAALLHSSRLSPVLLQDLQNAWSFLLGAGPSRPVEILKWWEESVLTRLAPRDVKSDPLEGVALEAVQDALTTLKEIQTSLWPNTAHLGQVLQELTALASLASPRETGEPLAGLQIISLTEARYVPCSALLIVGLAEGIFPHRLPQDTLIDNSLKRAAGMPGWRQLESLEETTFQLLATRVGHVELFWPESIADSVTIRSRWVERLASEGVAVISHTSREFAESVRVKDVGVTEVIESPGQEGQAKDLESLLLKTSARSLKAFMTCPYQFLLQRRKLSTLRGRAADDTIDLGERLHQIVELTCGQKGEARYCPPASLSWRSQFSDSKDLEDWALGRLQFFSDHLLTHDQMQNLTTIEVRTKGWPELAKTWARFFEWGWTPASAFSEWPIRNLSQGSELTLEIGSRKIAVSGVIDLLHTNGNGEWGILDFKTSAEPALRDIKLGLEPQLLLYALCVDEALPNAKPQNGMIAYWSLRQGKLTEIARGKDSPNAMTDVLGKSRQDLEDSLERFKRQWQGQLAAVESRVRFFADPQHCGFCDFSGICRRDDPRFQASLEKASIERAL